MGFDVTNTTAETSPRFICSNATWCGMNIFSTFRPNRLIWSRQFSLELRNTFLVGFILPLWALLWIRCSIVRAFGGVVLALVPDRVVRDGLLLVLVMLASPLLGGNTHASVV